MYLDKHDEHPRRAGGRQLEHLERDHRGGVRGRRPQQRCNHSAHCCLKDMDRYLLRPTRRNVDI